jgi:hypothetical protein
MPQRALMPFATFAARRQCVIRNAMSLHAASLYVWFYGYPKPQAEPGARS